MQDLSHIINAWGYGNMDIYMDVCCLNRPFDDLTQIKVQLEADAVLLILEQCQTGVWNLISSEAISLEINKITDPDRLQRVSALAQISNKFINITNASKKRAEILMTKGIKLFDSLHVALAEEGKVNVMLTTDEKLIRLAKRANTFVSVKNPVDWLMEVAKHEI